MMINNLISPKQQPTKLANPSPAVAFGQSLLPAMFFFFCINAMQKAPASTGAFFDRQLPTLPGRRQPSTIGLCVLNYCVRNGNRWNHAGIVTECVRKHSCSLKTIQKKVTEHLSPSRITYYLSGQRLLIRFAFARALGTFSPATCFPISFASWTGL